MGMVDHYLEIPGMVAGEDMSGKQYRGVVISADFTVVGVSNANTSKPIGILQNDPTSGEPAVIAMCGVCRAEAGGTITVGDSLAYNNSGDVISDAEVTDGTATDLHIIGMAIQAGVDTEIITIVLYGPVRMGLE